MQTAILIRDTIMHKISKNFTPPETEILIGYIYLPKTPETSSVKTHKIFKQDCS